jgi:adenine-specific DNA-methyltransferase
VARTKKSNGAAKPPAAKAGKTAERYTHPENTSPMRPDVGTQPQFRKKKPPTTWRYDSSLSPALDWDGQNGARELGEWLLGLIQEVAKRPIPADLDLKDRAAVDAVFRFDTPREFRALDGRVLVTVRSLGDAVDHLKRLGRPFLNWAGKAERLSFDVPTLPLFVHERLSTKAIVETLVGHLRQAPQMDMWELFGDPHHSIVDQTLRAYEYQDKWVNRLILGDSLVVMNSLLRYEGLGGQVQMIYIDPPYGVKFGSNFQPFVRKRDVTHNDDEDLTREPEMVKAYRDTWELGLHSYLTYLRDRLFLARELLSPSGSVFVQISNENLHYVHQVMDEVFGASNSVSIIPFAKTTGTATKLLSEEFDYLLWYARDIDRIKYRQLYLPKGLGTFKSYKYVEEPQAEGYRPLTKTEKNGLVPLPQGARVFQLSNLASQDPGPPEQRVYRFNGREYDCGPDKHWKTTNPTGIDRLVAAGRIVALGSQLNFKRYLDDFPAVPLTNLWDDTGSAGYSASDPKLYVVQTDAEVLQRCMLMTTDPGDLVLDPTCGSGTTAYVAEQWGRRWVTIDTSRVPLALARQRLLTATYKWYELKDNNRGPAGGFVYVRKRKKNGEETGGIVPHLKLENIANNEPSKEEVLVDRPEIDDKYVRVTGALTVEATIPTPVDWEDHGIEDSGSDQAGAYGSFVDRMIEVLRRSPVLHVGGGKTVQLWNIRRPAKTLSLSAEAMAVNGDERPVAFVFGPENGAVSEQLVHAALKEAALKAYSHLYVVGFAIQAHARDLIEKAADIGFLPATYVQATPDLMMGDLLKNMRSSQIFSVCGLPEVKIHPVKPEKEGDPPRYQVELVGLDTFDPTTMEVDHRRADDVPAWLLDTDYNDLCFHVSQAFFPRTSAWEGLRKALKGDYDDSVWDHLAGTKSAPFEAGEHGQIAVKVIDDRGNELLVVKKLSSA